MIVEKPLTPLQSSEDLIVPLTSSLNPRSQMTTTQVYYASMPEPNVDVEGLAREMDSNLNIVITDHPPPAYEEVSSSTILDTDTTTATPITPVSSVTTAVDEKPLPCSPANDNPVPVRERSMPNGGTHAERTASFRRQAPPSFRDDSARDRNAGPNGSPRSPEFEALVLHSKSAKLEDGFFAVPPPCDIKPHPFARRDVQEADWVRFLSDVKEAALHGPKPNWASSGQGRSNLFQAMGQSLRSGTFGSFFGQPGTNPASGNGMNQNAGPSGTPSSAYLDPASLIDLWNKNFFKPRGLEVVLAKGSRRLNGNTSLLPPDSSNTNTGSNVGMNMNFGSGFPFGSMGSGMGMGRFPPSAPLQRFGGGMRGRGWGPNMGMGMGMGPGFGHHGRGLLGPFPHGRGPHHGHHHGHHNYDGHERDIRHENRHSRLGSYSSSSSSSGSDTSDSDSDSYSDSETVVGKAKSVGKGKERSFIEPEPNHLGSSPIAGPSAPIVSPGSSRAARRAEKHARRHDRKMRRMERRLERDQGRGDRRVDRRVERMERKQRRFERRAEKFQRRYSRWADIGGSTRSGPGAVEEDGYFRLIVIDVGVRV